MRQIVADRRILVSAASLILVSLVWYFSLFLGQRAEVRRLETEIQDVESRLSSWISKTKALSDYYGDYVTLEQERRRFLAKIPRARQVQGLAEQIIDVGRKHGCNVTYVGMPFDKLFSEEAVVNSSAYSDLMVLPLKLIVRGRFIPIGRFMEALAQLPFFTSFGELQMSRLPNGDGELEANFSIRVYVKRNLLKRRETSEG